jgi:hypothetical protein
MTDIRTDIRQSSLTKPTVEDLPRATPPAAPSTSQVIPMRRPVVPQLPPVGDEVLRAFATNASQVPAAVADLRLYTDDALEREIATGRGRSAAHPGPEGDGDRLALGRLEGELLRRHTPAPIDVDSLSSRQATDEAIERERVFLARHGGELAAPTRAAHEQTIDALQARKKLLAANDRVCDNAQPSVASLPGGEHRLVFTADDLVASLQKRGPLSPEAEAAARTAFDGWHRSTCALTGTDPTVIVSRERYAEARANLSPAQQKELTKRLEMLEAARTSAAAALAFVDSQLRGDTLETTHQRVKSAAALGELAGAAPHIALPSPHFGREDGRLIHSGP